MTFRTSFLARFAAISLLAASFAVAGCSEMMSRSDFTARVKDKSDTEVAKLVGKPSAVDESKPERVTWTYTSRTFNVDERNKFDSKAVVVFNKTGSKLVVADVTFE